MELSVLKISNDYVIIVSFFLGHFQFMINVSNSNKIVSIILLYFAVDLNIDSIYSFVCGIWDLMFCILCKMVFGI